MASKNMIASDFPEKPIYKGSLATVVVEECAENVLIVSFNNGMKVYKGVLLDTNSRWNQYGVNPQRVVPCLSSGVDNGLGNRLEPKTTPCTAERYSYKYDGQPSTLTVFCRQNQISKRDRKPPHRILRPRRFVCRKCRNLFPLDDDGVPDDGDKNKDNDLGATSGGDGASSSGEKSKSVKRKRVRAEGTESSQEESYSLDNGIPSDDQTIRHVTPSIIPKMSPKMSLSGHRSDENVSDSTSKSTNRSLLISPGNNSADSSASKSNVNFKKRKLESSDKSKEKVKLKKLRDGSPSLTSHSVPVSTSGKLVDKLASKKIELEKMEASSSLKKASSSASLSSIAKSADKPQKSKKYTLIDFDQLTHKKPPTKSSVQKQKTEIETPNQSKKSELRVDTSTPTAPLKEEDSTCDKNNAVITKSTDISDDKSSILPEPTTVSHASSTPLPSPSVKTKVKKSKLKEISSRTRSSSISPKKTSAGGVKDSSSTTPSVYEFDGDTSSPQKEKLDLRRKSIDYEKPKNRWMREERIRRYQEERSENIKNLKEERPKRRVSSLSNSSSVKDDSNITLPTDSPSERVGIKIKINRKSEASGTASYKVQLVKKDKEGSTEPESVRSPASVAESEASTKQVCNGGPPPPVSRRATTCSVNKLAKPIGDVPKDMDKLTDVQACRTAKGVAYRVNDVVWAKITGWPFWPSKIISISTDGEKSYTACVSWFAWDQISYISCDKLFHFQDHYNSKFIKKKKGAYKLAVDQAWLEAQARRLDQEHEIQIGSVSSSCCLPNHEEGTDTDNYSPVTTDSASASHPVISEAARNARDDPLMETCGDSASIYHDMRTSNQNQLINDPLLSDPPLDPICPSDHPLPDLGPHAMDANVVSQIPTFSDDEELDTDNAASGLMIDSETFSTEFHRNSS